LAAGFSDSLYVNDLSLKLLLLFYQLVGVKRRRIELGTRQDFVDLFDTDFPLMEYS
jgi:hypothetical protein